MEIEITTTKKKLTKALIDQMAVASLSEMKVAVVLGYVLNVRKGTFKTLIVKSLDKYRVVPVYDWSKLTGESGIYRRVKNFSTTVKKFETEEIRDEWLSAYNELVAISTIQIYI